MGRLHESQLSRSSRRNLTHAFRCGLPVLLFGLIANADEPFSLRPDFRYVVNQDGLPQTADEVVIPRALIETVAEAEIALSLDENTGLGAIVFRVVGLDRRPFGATVEIEYMTPGQIGVLSKKVKAGDADSFYTRHGMAYELRAFAPGYETITRKFILTRDQIIIWDDLVLEPIPVREGGIVDGIASFEDGSRPNDLLILVDGDSAAFADPVGRFSVTGLRTGNVSISAERPGYYGLETRVQVTRPLRSNCKLFGFVGRVAVVRWTYQPDGSRDFRNGTLSGTLNLKHSPDRGYALGNRNLTKRYEGDFFVRQEQDKLQIIVYEQPGPEKPGMAHICGVPFDDVGEVPDVPLEAAGQEMRPGDVFVFRCFDRKHFAKIEVLEIATEIELGRKR